MISIIRSAKDIDFCGNGLRFRVKSNNAFSASGSFAELTLNVNSNPISGNEFTFSFGDKVVKFTCSNVQDNSGTMFIAGSGVAAIVDVMKQNYLLQKYYNISYLGNSITLMPKLAGSYYSLSFTANNNRITSYSNQPGTDRLLRSSFKTLCEIYLERDRVNNLFDLVATSLHNVDDAAECNILPGLLLAKYFSDIDLPTYNQTAIKKVSKVAKRFYVKLAEMFEGSVKSVVTSGMFYAVDGKINSDLFSDIFDFITAAAANKYYLLDPSVAKIETWSDAQQFLYFVNSMANIAITHKIKLYYTDGTNTTMTKETFAGVLKGECLIVPAGFSQLNLQAVVPAKECYKYEVWLENAGVVIGKVISYYLVPKPLYGREFWFKNSMGGMEALLCEKQIHKLDIKRSELLSNNNYATDIDEINDSYECITGNKTMREIEHIAEFVASKKTYLLQKGIVYEVALEQGSYTLADETEDLYNYKFKYRVMASKAAAAVTTVIIGNGTGGVGIVKGNLRRVLIGI
ncbi:MAG: hypothetical protein ACOYOV_07565 [Bacteroidales bacterium]